MHFKNHIAQWLAANQASPFGSLSWASLELALLADQPSPNGSTSRIALKKGASRPQKNCGRNAPLVQL